MLDLGEIRAAVADGAAAISRDFYIRWINEPLQRTYGDVVGLRCYQVFAPGRQVPCSPCAMIRVLDEGEPFIKFPAVDQQGNPLEVTVTPLSREEGSGVVLAVARDIRVDRDLQEKVTLLARDLKDRANKLECMLGLCQIIADDSALENLLSQCARRLATAVRHPELTSVSIVFDGREYAYPAEIQKFEIQDSNFIASDVRVNGQLRGHVRVCYAKDKPFPEEDVQLVRWIADQIASRAERDSFRMELKGWEERCRTLTRDMEAAIQQQTREYQAVSAELQNIIYCSPDMIITTDMDRRIVSFNPGAERILGYKREEVLGRPIEEFWEHTEERQLLLKRLEQEGVISNYETRLRTCDGRLVDVFLSIAELRDDEGRILGTVGVSKDITEQKRAQIQMERLNENFRQILYFINHEVKNALVSICGFANRLDRKLKDEELKKMASTIFQTGLFLERIIDRFLLISRIESGELKTRIVWIKDLEEEVIRPVIQPLGKHIPYSIDMYDLSMGGAPHISLAGDVELLQVIYRNLFSNALKYGLTAGKIAYGVEDHGDFYQFNVWNEGPGIPQEERELIFENFVRLEHSGGQPGTGLGLYITRRIIEAMGGRIWVESQPGQWTNFIFRLPKRGISSGEKGSTSH